MTKRQIELLIESISYHQLHLQKMYEQYTGKIYNRRFSSIHDELCEITKILIKELDKFEQEE